MNHRLHLALVTLVALVAVGGCERQKSAAQVQRDTSAAQASAAGDTAKAEEHAGERVASADKDVRTEERDAQHVGAVQSEQVADTQAEGAHKVAAARCERLSGSAQKSCRDQANADLDAAKASARVQRANTDPKP